MDSDKSFSLLAFTLMFASVSLALTFFWPLALFDLPVWVPYVIQQYFHTPTSVVFQSYGYSPLMVYSSWGFGYVSRVLTWKMNISKAVYLSFISLIITGVSTKNRTYFLSSIPLLTEIFVFVTKNMTLKLRLERHVGVPPVKRRRRKIHWLEEMSLIKTLWGGQE